MIFLGNLGFFSMCLPISSSIYYNYTRTLIKQKNLREPKDWGLLPSNFFFVPILSGQKNPGFFRTPARQLIHDHSPSTHQWWKKIWVQNVNPSSSMHWRSFWKANLLLKSMPGRIEKGRTFLSSSPCHFFSSSSYLSPSTSVSSPPVLSKSFPWSSIVRLIFSEATFQSGLSKFCRGEKGKSEQDCLLSPNF